MNGITGVLRHGPQLERVNLEFGSERMFMSVWNHDDPNDWWHTDHYHAVGGTIWILRGGYTEVRVAPGGAVIRSYVRKAGERFVVPSNTWHRIEDVQPGTVSVVQPA